MSFLRFQGVSLAWNSPSKLGGQAVSSRDPSVFASPVLGYNTRHHVMLALKKKCSYWASNSGLCACKASSFPTKLSLRLSGSIKTKNLCSETNGDPRKDTHIPSSMPVSEHPVGLAGLDHTA